MILKHRTFTQELKQEIVEQALFRSISVGQLSRQHNIARQLIYKWIREYNKGQLSKTSKPREAAKARIEDLESLVGRLMIDNELLKKALKAVQEAQRPNAIISGTTEIPLDQ